MKQARASAWTNTCASGIPALPSSGACPLSPHCQERELLPLLPVLPYLGTTCTAGPIVLAILSTGLTALLRNVPLASPGALSDWRPSNRGEEGCLIPLRP